MAISRSHWGALLGGLVIAFLFFAGGVLSGPECSNPIRWQRGRLREVAQFGVSPFPFLVAVERARAERSPPSRAYVSIRTETDGEVLATFVYDIDGLFRECIYEGGLVGGEYRQSKYKNKSLPGRPR